MTTEVTDNTAPVDESTADSGAQDEAPATEATQEESGAEALGDPGKKALDAMKADRNAAKAEAKRIADEFAAFKAQAEGKEAEYTASVEAQRVKDEALAAANDRIKRAEVRAAAAGKLNDPKDALSFLDLSTIEVNDDGEVDGDAVASAIADLVQSKPYLAAQGKRFEGDADGGARKESGPTQLTEADVRRLSAEGKHDEIVKAKAEGRLTDYLTS